MWRRPPPAVQACEARRYLWDPTTVEKLHPRSEPDRKTREPLRNRIPARQNTKNDEKFTAP